MICCSATGRLYCYAHCAVVLSALGIITVALMPGYYGALYGAPAVSAGHQQMEAQVSSEDSDGSDDGWGEEEPVSTLMMRGFLEMENHFSTNREQEPGSVSGKNEFRGMMFLKYGTAAVYFESESSLYAIPYLVSTGMNGEYRYSEGTVIHRNLRVSSEGSELSFRKLFVNYETGTYRFRAGNQIIAWGTADVFGPTSYFNPYDLREFLFKGEDEQRLGVPALSCLRLFGNDSLELVVVPVHVPIAMPVRGNFWEIRYREGPFPIVLDEPEGLPAAFENIGAGLQYYTNRLGTDIYVSLYHGPDREPVMRPLGTVAEPGRPVAVEVRPEYCTVTNAGIAASRTFGKFVVQCEGVYSPDKAGVVWQDFNKDITLPFDVARSQYAAYSTGFNYFIPMRKFFRSHEGDAVLTMEWSQAFYIDDRIMKPLITDILIARIQDSFTGNRLKVFLTGIMDFGHRSSVVMPEVQYRFQCGVSAAVSYAHIQSDSESYIGYYDDNDLLTVRVRYDL
ncbi:MAG TPA: hypothetical protein PK544_17185 [Spirochaetota bacterium]|nr:hypothetical protein [Spirochaetota bacterium]